MNRLQSLFSRSARALNVALLPLAAFVALMLAACDVHQFPEPPKSPDIPNVDPDDPNIPDGPDEPTPDPPVDPDLLVDLSLHFTYTTPLYVWEHYYDPVLGRVVEANPEADVDGAHPGTTAVHTGVLEKGIKHITARFFRNGNTSSSTQLEEFAADLADGYDAYHTVRIMPGNYDLVAWTDFRESDEHPRFYNADNFHSIKIDYDVYRANTDHRDSYRGRVPVTVNEGEDAYAEVPMYRPMAKYEFVTTDLSEFLDKETSRRGLSSRATIDDYNVRIHYSTYHPSAYSAVDDRLENSVTGVSFATDVTITGESEASLGFDYVFINDYSDAGVQATIVVSDLQGNTVAQSSQITVPLRRDHHTVLRGAFLTMNSSGGVGIDPGFDGDHNITVR